MSKAQDGLDDFDDGFRTGLSPEDLTKPLLISNDNAGQQGPGPARRITRAAPRASPQAPLLDRVDLPRVTITPNASLYDTDPPSILRIPTGPEADAEWFRIGTGVMPIIISSDEIYKLGKDPSVAVKIPEEHGYGDDAYIAQTEVFHLLHCLDMLRKEISYDHYYFARFGNHPDAEHVAHIGHCIDILAQTIKCSSSVDVILFNWVEGWDQPFPDFSNQHVCRDFETLLGYVTENSVPRSVWKTMKEPPAGYVRLPEPAPARPAESDTDP
ncbi:hypothetical protein BDV38DRAFT_276264 [Aspergillus pseudotamarii]|uniref:Tat pathway signal sequence n=1 Tax=Aspergillus pseudotamarii TaxID=132259 RepID=A0A5N6S923_ASPPS|nr:uncharacterized protein BDV38DRAFT_276264 [Aspergillus pseudotamarii]KAE8131055.1 hypothetical protein BDV38DRAFT_276264 [Aspergillus pseudotamarii]